jgi:hypothetical protein
MSQKDVVYKAIKTIHNFNDGDKVILAPEERAEVNDIIAKELHENRLTEFSKEASEKYDTEEKIRKQYANGLLNNYLRKDKRLNGGVKYEIKNPGSRISNPEIREMTKLLKEFERIGDEDNMALLEEAIETKKKELAAAKAKTLKINIDLLPQDIVDNLPEEILARYK